MVKADEVPTQLSADMAPDDFIGKVVSVEDEKVNTKGQPVINVTTQFVGGKLDGENFIVSYKRSKALTGKGQLDLLFDTMAKLDMNDTQQLKGNIFHWKRLKIAGGMGNARHYPVEELAEDGTVIAPKAVTPGTA
jgi:hypothetical protein